MSKEMRELLIAPKRYKGIKRFSWYWRNFIAPALTFVCLFLVLTFLAAILN